MSDKVAIYMRNKKMVSVVLVVLLLISVVGVLFTTGVRAQPYSGSVWTTDDEGNFKNNFLEGDNLYFVIELDQSEEVGLTVRLRDADDVPVESRTITTDDTGFYRSHDEDVFFDLTDKRAGDYHIQIRYDGEEIDTADIEIHSNYASGSMIETYEDSDHTVQTDHFVVGETTYFMGRIADARDEPLQNSMITVSWMTEDGVYHSENVVTDEEGEFDGEFNWQSWITPGAPEPDDYLVEVTYDYEGVFDEQTLVDKHVVVYEQDFSVNSQVYTTDSDHETPKDYFTVGEMIYYRLELEDQYGKNPVTNTMINTYWQRGDEDPEFEYSRNVGTDGVLEASFPSPPEEGEYTLLIYDQLEDVVYAETTFTMISMDISIYPDRHMYTQGQTIEIRIESNFPDEIDVGITNSTVAPYRHMDGAQWTSQSFTNEMWTAEYLIPMDESDGDYYIVVNRSEDDEIIAFRSFSIKKYSLEASTDKNVYLPGEQVDVHYRVTNHLDGSQATGVEIEWMMGYLDDENDVVTKDGTAVGEHFSFELPADAMVNREFGIVIWANDTAEGYEDEIYLERSVGEPSVDVTTDRYTYLLGQSVFIDTSTYANRGWRRSPAGGVDVEISLIRDGEPVEGFTSTITTDRSGYKGYYLNLPETLEPGLYNIRANATWDDMWDVDTVEIEVIDELESLVVHLERDKGVNAYYPGETVNVSYWVTHGGEEITDVNVRYHIYSNAGTHGYGFAEDGFIRFQVPTDFNPNDHLELEVIATRDQDVQGSNTISIPVTVGRVLLNPSEWEYRAGDNISFEYELVGVSEDQVDSVEYQILDPNNDVISRGTPIDQGFYFAVPEIPRDSYRARITVLTTGGHILTQTEGVNRIADFRLELTVETSSDYTTGVYRPGQEITVRYRLVSEDEEALPESVRVQYNFGHYLRGEFSTTETDGKITIEVPDVEDGIYAITVSADGNQDMRTVEIENEPSWMNRRIIGGFGAFDLLVVVLIIVVLILALMSFMKLYSVSIELPKRKEKKGKELSEEEVEDREPGYSIEEGEAEPDDLWKESSQIEPEDRDW